MIRPDHASPDPVIGGVSNVRAALCRADLLRRIAGPRDGERTVDAHGLALDDGAHWFGYRRKPEIVDQPEHKPVGDRETGSATTAVSHPRLPPRVSSLVAVTERRHREPETGEDTLEDGASHEPLTEEELKAKEPDPLYGHDHLVPKSRLIPSLKRHLSALRAGPIDLAALTRLVAERQPLRRIPRRRTTRWSPELVVVFDRSERLGPIRFDQNFLAKLLRDECGRSGLSLRVVPGPPPQRWREWRSKEELRPSVLPERHSWRPLPRGTRVLVVSDLGLAGRRAPELQIAWQGFLASLVERGCKPVVLLPLGANQVDTRQYPGVLVLRWSPDSRMRPERTGGRVEAGTEPGLTELLAMVAGTRSTEPSLLRALRRLNPVAPHNAGLELAVWSHPDIVTGSAAQFVSTEVQERHKRVLESLAPTLRDRHLNVRRRYHAHFRAAVSHEEDWLAGVEGPWREFFERLIVTLRDGAQVPSGSELGSYAERVVGRASPAMIRRNPRAYYRLVREARRGAAARGCTVQLPGHVDPAAVARATPEGGSVSARLVEDRLGRIELDPAAPDGTKIELADPLVVDSGGFVLRPDGDGDGPWHDLPRGATLIASGPAPVNVAIETSSERLRLQRVLRPLGCAGWGRGRDGLWVETASLGSARHLWRPEHLAFESIEGGPQRGCARVVAQGLTRVATAWGERVELAFGIDSPFGVFADLTLASARKAPIVQRFRWIEPGEFEMGSPEGEDGSSDERPAHRVVLTRGFWLADTACAQGLWEAVMGENPSSFKGVDRPVEQVSWLVVQEFLAKLESLFPGIGAGLPTEAEWEYACRAGTRTPFWFGETITPEVVNYDGNQPYGSAEKGLYRQETVDVKALPSNAWGLYQMHGNVWEWCRDGRRSYADGEAVNPVGPDRFEEARMVRGGGWMNFAGNARSALRSDFYPGFTLNHLGFRLRLRSLGSGPARPPAEQAE